MVFEDSRLPLGSRTLFAEAVSRNVRFSTLFKVQGQMKVAGQGSSRDRFPQVYVHPLVRICRCQTLVFGSYEKKHADSVTKVRSGGLQGMGAKIFCCRCGIGDFACILSVEGDMQKIDGRVRLAINSAVAGMRMAKPP